MNLSLVSIITPTKGALRMTNDQIEIEMKMLVAQERNITTRILKLILMAEEQKLHLERGFKNLLEWLVQGHGYSERAAMRRIKAAVLLRAAPNTAEKIQSGQVNLTTLSQVHSAIRFHEKASGARLSSEEKIKVIEKIENKTSEETERALFSIFPELASGVKQEHTRAIDAETSRLAMNLSNETLEDLKRIQELLSHSHPNASFAKVIALLAKEYLSRKDPLQKEVRQKCGAVRGTRSVMNTGVTCITAPTAEVVLPQNLVPNPGVPPAQRVDRLSQSTRRLVLKRAQGRCEYRDFQTGRICGSRHQIEVDHITPKALGGGNELENLRCLCRAHNALMAERNLGSLANNWRNRSSN